MHDLIVIDKPAGLVVHPAAGNPDGTLVNALIAHCGKSLGGVGGVARPGIVHRLDKDTSGLLVAAKNDRAMASLAKQFAARTIERAYHAAAWGAPRAGEGVIEGDIGRNPFDRKRMAVVRSQGKAARTRYRMLERYGDAARAFASLIECRLETGRTHQIRVHLAHLGHPLIGDGVYGRARRPPRAKTEAEAAAYTAAAEFPASGLACVAARLPASQPPQTSALRSPMARRFRGLGRGPARHPFQQAGAWVRASRLRRWQDHPARRGTPARTLKTCGQTPIS